MLFNAYAPCSPSCPPPASGDGVGVGVRPQTQSTRTPVPSFRAPKGRVNLALRTEVRRSTRSPRYARDEDGSSRPAAHPDPERSEGSH